MKSLSLSLSLVRPSILDWVSEWVSDCGWKQAGKRARWPLSLSLSRFCARELFRRRRRLTRELERAFTRRRRCFAGWSRSCSGWVGLAAAPHGLLHTDTRTHIYINTSSWIMLLPKSLRWTLVLILHSKQEAKRDELSMFVFLVHILA